MASIPVRLLVWLWVPAATAVVAANLAPVQDRPPEPTQVLVLDFEKPKQGPTVWIVNAPNEDASVSLSTTTAREGKQALELRYRFEGDGEFRYLGIPNPFQIQAPIHELRYWLKGDGSRCSYGIQVQDASGETHQYGQNTGQGGTIDFQDWREIAYVLDAPHETWGGDRNGKLDYPLTGLNLIVGQPTGEHRKPLPARGVLIFDSVSVRSEASAEETLGSVVKVLEPANGAAIEGEITIRLSAPGFQKLEVRCWKAGPGQGADSLVAAVELDPQGQGSFRFPSGKYPHGPLTIRIRGERGRLRDCCYLQVYNTSGTPWNAGIPDQQPPAAAGMKLVFEDDFTGPLSISGRDPSATYYDHKPPHGYQDFSVHRFADHESPQNPFAQVQGYLRIRADDATRTSGLISSLRNDGSGIKVKAPCYFECRFLGPNAVGSWPGFWLMTDYMTGYDRLKVKTPCDELDIIEAYGGEGPGSPSAGDTYMVTPHCWNQGDAGKALETRAFEGLRNPVRMRRLGVPSTWFEAFHTYGCQVTETETIYYCDNIEVGRHATFPLSRTEPLFFMINLATGGGWPVDLSRYGQIDMYVDYIRVYGKAP